MPPNRRREQDQGVDAGDLGEFLGGLIGAFAGRKPQPKQMYDVIWYWDNNPGSRKREQFEAEDAIEALQRFREAHRGEVKNMHVERIRPARG